MMSEAKQQDGLSKAEGWAEQMARWAEQSGKMGGAKQQEWAEHSAKES